MTRGLLRQREKFAFHQPVLGVRRARSDERVVSRRDLPNLPCGKKRRNFKEEQHYQEEQHFRRAAFEEQLLSAAFLSSLSQQPFSAAFLSSLSQQPFSAALLSSLSQQPVSAAFLSSLSQQPFSAAFLSSPSQQPFSAAFLSSLSQLPSSAIILLWSGVGGQLVTSCCGQGLVVKFATLSGKTPAT